MKRYSDSEVFSELSSAKKKLIILAAVILWAAWQIIGAGAYIGHLAKLRSFDKQEYYSLICALNSFFMCTAVPLIASLGDRIGRKWLICIGITVEMLVDLGTALSPNIFVFAFFWTLSGFTSGCFMTAPYLLISDVVEFPKRPHYMGYVQVAGALGLMLSPVTAGLLADHGMAKLVYLQCVPFISTALLILLVCYPDYRPGTESHRIDLAGIGLMMLTVGLFIFLFNFGGRLFPWLSWQAALCAAGILGFGVLLVRHELRESCPVLSVKLLARPNLRSACICGLLFNFYAVCAGGYIIVYVQNVMGRAATTSGAVLMPQTVIYSALALFIGNWAAKKTGRFRAAYIAAGIAAAAAMAVVSLMGPDSSVAFIYVAMMFGGVAYSVMGTLNIPYAQKCLRPEEYGTGQGTVQFFTSCTSCLVISLFNVLLSSGANMEQGLKAIYLTTGILSLGLAAYAALFMKKSHENTIA